MATATLENVNPYSKYGLKRRPTYDEIANLIGENETITGALPDRTATKFKASQEGSFFDGMDSLEILKEEDKRIHNRQLRDLMMRQNLGGRTFGAERLRDQMRNNAPPQPPTDRDTNVSDAQMQTELQNRANQAVARSQQTGEAHRGILSNLTTPAMLRNMFDLRLPSLSRGSNQPLPQPIPKDGRVTPKVVNHPDEYDIGSNNESEPEMQSARGVNKEDLIFHSLKFKNPNVSNAELVRSVDVLVEYKDLTPEKIAKDFSSFSILNHIYSALLRNGIITDEVYMEYQNITDAISSEGKGSKRAKLLRQLAEHYRDNIYDVYIDDIGNRPVTA